MTWTCNQVSLLLLSLLLACASSSSSLSLTAPVDTPVLTLLPLTVPPVNESGPRHGNVHGRPNGGGDNGDNDDNGDNNSKNGHTLRPSSATSATLVPTLHVERPSRPSSAPSTPARHTATTTTTMWSGSSAPTTPAPVPSPDRVIQRRPGAIDVPHTRATVAPTAPPTPHEALTQPASEAVTQPTREAHAHTHTATTSNEYKWVAGGVAVAFGVLFVAVAVYALRRYCQSEQRFDNAERRAIVDDYDDHSITSDDSDASGGDVSTLTSIERRRSSLF